MTESEMLAAAGKPADHWAGEYGIDCYRYRNGEYAIVSNQKIIRVLSPGAPFSEIVTGMPEPCVEGTVGKPDYVLTKANAKLFTYSRSSPDGDNKDFFVQFIDGCVESFGKMGEFDVKNIMNIDERAVTSRGRTK